MLMLLTLISELSTVDENRIWNQKNFSGNNPGSIII